MDDFLMIIGEDNGQILSKQEYGRNRFVVVYIMVVQE